MSLHEGSITDADFVRKSLAKTRPQIVFHLAGILRKDNSEESLSSNMDVNFFGTQNLLKALPQNIERFVFVSTSEGYSGSIPFLEESRRSPLSPYSLSKMCAEALCDFYSNVHNIPITILRPFNVYGPSQGRGMLIPDLIMSMLGGETPKTTKGEQTRDYIYIDDLIDSLLMVSLSNDAVGKTFNVCSGKEIKTREIIRMISGMAGGKADIGSMPYRKNEVWRHFGDNRKIKSLGWEPKTGIENGLKKTVEWYRNHRRA
jgi:nucleoside-diphosphate-sugar epimerase